MAASIKLSELPSIGATEINQSDIMMMTDVSAGKSRSVTYGALESALTDQLNAAVNALVALTGAGSGSVGIGNTGSVVAQDVTVVQAITQLSTAINNLQASIDAKTQTLQANIDALDYVSPGNNINRLTANTSADSEPADCLHLVVDKATGQIKAIENQILEITPG